MAVDRKGEKKKEKREDVVGNLNLQTSLNEGGSINNRGNIQSRCLFCTQKTKPSFSMLCVTFSVFPTSSVKAPIIYRSLLKVFKMKPSLVIITKRLFGGLYKKREWSHCGS